MSLVRSVFPPLLAFPSNFAGRWNPLNGIAYIRNSEASVTKSQTEVSKQIRTSGDVDCCAEGGTLRKLTEFAVSRGLPLEEIEAMNDRIVASRTAITMLGVLPGEAPFPVEPIEVDEFENLEVDERFVGREVLGKGMRVISVTRGGSSRTLHEIGACWRVPGVHYRHYCLLDVGEIGDYRSLCKECYPKQIDPLAKTDDVDSDTDSDESSDSSSSSG